MALVDPDDDSLARYVIWHYRFDGARHERRNVVVAAYDSEGEFLTEVERLRTELKLRQVAGEAEVVESISGTLKRPGHAAEQRERRSGRSSPGRKARERKRT